LHKFCASFDRLRRPASSGPRKRGRRRAILGAGVLAPVVAGAALVSGTASPVYAATSNPISVFMLVPGLTGESAQKATENPATKNYEKLVGFSLSETPAATVGSSKGIGRTTAEVTATMPIDSFSVHLLDDITGGLPPNKSITVELLRTSVNKQLGSVGSEELFLTYNFKDVVFGNYLLQDDATGDSVQVTFQSLEMTVAYNSAGTSGSLG
jgi:type VI protein secretion system component Hcp